MTDELGITDKIISIKSLLMALIFILTVTASGAIWAFDAAHTKFMTYDSHAKFELKKERRFLIKRISILKIDLKYPLSANEKKRTYKKLIEREAELTLLN